MSDLDRVVKNLYDRLYKKGFNVPKNTIKAAVLEVSAEGTLTDEQKSQIVEKFMAVTEAGVQDDSQAALPSDEEVLNAYHNQPPVESSAITPTTPPASTPGALTTSQAREIVFDRCESMGIELKTSEIKAIVQEIQAQHLDAQAAVNYTITVIKQFINAQERQYTSNLTEGMQELVQHVNTSFRNREAVTVSAFEKVKGELTEAASAYKSSTVNYTADLQEYFSDKIA